MAEGYDEPIREPGIQGVRSMQINSYEIPRVFYSLGTGGRNHGSAVKHADSLGLMIWYAHTNSHTGRGKRIPMDVEKMAGLWKDAVVGLAMAHDKDEADRYEASIESCLTPILAAPIKQVRELAPAILAKLQADPRVPYLIWRSYEIWAKMIAAAPDEDVLQLKRDLAQEIVNLVETDAKKQLPEAMVRALMWRSGEKLAEVKTVVEKEKAAGRGIRIKGRESCLFLEAGGTEDEPAVCVQI